MMTNQASLILAFADYLEPAERLAREMDIPLAVVESHRFPDGESRLVLPTPLPKRVIVCRSLNQPNDKLIELMLVADTARDLGVETLLLVAPYLCYMRQDMAFHVGEAVSQRSIGRFIQRYYDGLITVDPHLHRVHDLKEVVQCKHAIALSAMPAIAQYIKSHFQNGYLIGPDQESEQWLADVATLTGLPYVVGRKQRDGDKDVSITLPVREYHGRNLLIIDDIASTAHTLVQTIRALAPSLPASMSILVTHGLFVGDAFASLDEQKLQRIISTDSIPHTSNAIELAPILATGLRSILG